MWIEFARRQSDAADRAAAEIDAEGMAFLAADHFPGYELQREIHRGAQGAVYRALHRSTGRVIALKVLHEHALGGPLERARFEREMQVLAALRHPNIVAIHDGGSHNGRFFLVMDYIAGEPLDAYMTRRPRSIRETLGLFAAVCDAVNAAHVRGVIHRDLKPANVRVDAGGRPYVLDFGLAKWNVQAPSTLDLESAPSSASSACDPMRNSPPAAVTGTGQFLGSLPWAAPEQAEGSPTRVDMRSDVYSLGVLLYQMLSGRLPYRVAGPMRQALDAILHSSPSPLRELRRDVDDELETIVLKCLNKESSRRYQTAGELADDVRRYLAGEPIEAKRDSGWYRARVFLRRNRLPGAAAAIIVAMLLGAFAFSLAQWRFAEQEWQRAELQNRKLQHVNRFVQDLLTSADPYALPAGDVPAYALLDNASRDIEAGALRDQPGVEAAVRTTLGRAYATLARYETAASHLEAALRIIEHSPPSDQVTLADALLALAEVRQATRDFDNAEALARRALAVRRATVGEVHEDVAAAWEGLAGVLHAAQRLDEAEDAMRTAVGVWRAALGTHHPRVAAAVARLAMYTHDTGESTDLLREAVRRFEEAGQTHSLPYAAALSDLARIQHLRREYPDAEASYRRAIEVRRERLGPNHLHVLNDLDNLTLLYMQRGDWPAALGSSRELLACAQAVYGDDSPRVAQALMHVAVSCRRVGDNAPGLAAARQALEIQERAGNGQSIDGLHARLGVAALALSCGEFELAETAARESLATPDEVLSVQPWRKPLAQSLLGAALTERGSFEAAEPLLLAGYEGLSRSHNPPPDSRESAGRRIERLYERWDAAQPSLGKARIAEQWRVKLGLAAPAQE